MRASRQLPLGLLNAAQGHPMLVELKNGETLNGHLVMCDTWMNLTLKEVVQTSPVRLPTTLPQRILKASSPNEQYNRKEINSCDSQKSTSREITYADALSHHICPGIHPASLANTSCVTDQVPSCSRRDHRPSHRAAKEPARRRFPWRSRRPSIKRRSRRSWRPRRRR